MPYVFGQTDIGATLSDAWARVVELTPQIVLFLVILIVGWLIARGVASLLDTVLEKVGFDRWVERGGIRRALGGTDLDASDLLSKIVFYALFLIVLQLAFGVFGPNAVSELIEGIVAYLPNIFVAILIMVVAAYLAAAARDIVRGMIGGTQLGGFLATGSYVAILVIGIFAALAQLEIAPTIVNGLFYALLAIIVGSAIVAIGGGGIAPMRRRLEEWMNSAEANMAEVKAEAARTSGETPAGTSRPSGETPASATEDGPISSGSRRTTEERF
ncbi:MAG TPA: hypothetical protein VHL52_07275 [Acidimicrobiia bacterium]|nr:hypothetical protein [Acidimicrobiia bacterium]